MSQVISSNNFEVIIIGGGIYGSSCAYYLSKQNKKVLLVEKERIGSAGATSYSRGIVRAYDDDPDLAALSLEGAIRLSNWEKEQLPGKTPYTGSGFLYLLSEKKANRLVQFAAKYSSKDYPMRLLTSKELRRRFPWLKNESQQVGFLEEKGGYGDPWSTAIKLMEGFREQGGSVFENCPVQGFSQLGNGQWEVDLLHSKISAKVLLFTTGAYSKSFFPDLPIFTRSISLTQVADPKMEVNISLIDEDIETYLRPGEGASFYCGSQIFEAVSVPDELEPHSISECNDSMERLQHIFSKPAPRSAMNSFKGFDCYTKEKRPIVQFLPNYEGIYLATGFSGRGYKCAIKLGELIADEINAYLGIEQQQQENNNWKINLLNDG